MVRRLLLALLVSVAAVLQAVPAVPRVWYIPGWLRCGQADEAVLAGLRAAYPGAEVSFCDWDGNGLWGRCTAEADRHAERLASLVASLPAAERLSLTLVGHSLGGRMAVRVLARLNRLGKPVRHAVLLGAAIPSLDRDVSRMTGGSVEPIWNVCNPDDLTLKGVYALWGGEAAAALGSSGLPSRPGGVREFSVPRSVLSDVSFGGFWKDLPAVKRVALHHARFYISHLIALRQCASAPVPDAGAGVIFQDGVNLRLRVWNGGVWWEVLERVCGWELQRHRVTGLCRILNADGIREAWGSEPAMRVSFRKISAGICRD